MSRVRPDRDDRGGHYPRRLRRRLDRARRAVRSGALLHPLRLACPQPEAARANAKPNTAGAVRGQRPRLGAVQNAVALNGGPRGTAVAALEDVSPDSREHRAARPFVNDDGRCGAGQASRPEPPCLPAVEGHIRPVPRPQKDDVRVGGVDRIRPGTERRLGESQRAPGASTILAPDEPVSLCGVQDRSRVIGTEIRRVPAWHLPQPRPARPTVGDREEGASVGRAEQPIGGPRQRQQR
jgi:hypothetical protein